MLYHCNKAYKIPTEEPGTGGDAIWTAFFTDVPHEILPVTQNYRVSLTYHLLRRLPSSSPSSIAQAPQLSSVSPPQQLGVYPSNDSNHSLPLPSLTSVEVLAAVLDRLWRVLPFSRVLCPLAHKYSSRTLTRAPDNALNLKGADSEVYAVLAHATALVSNRCIKGSHQKQHDTMVHAQLLHTGEDGYVYDLNGDENDFYHEDVNSWVLVNDDLFRRNMQPSSVTQWNGNGHSEFGFAYASGVIIANLRSLGAYPASREEFAQIKITQEQILLLQEENYSLVMEWSLQYVAPEFHLMEVRLEQQHQLAHDLLNQRQESLELLAQDLEQEDSQLSQLDIPQKRELETLMREVKRDFLLQHDSLQELLDRQSHEFQNVKREIARYLHFEWSRHQGGRIIFNDPESQEAREFLVAHLQRPASQAFIAEQVQAMQRLLEWQQEASDAFVESLRPAIKASFFNLHESIGRLLLVSPSPACSPNSPAYSPNSPVNECAENP